VEKLLLFLPETTLLVGALGALLLSIAGRTTGRAWAWSLLAAGAGLAASLATLGLSGEPFFPGIYRVDFATQLLKAGLALGLLLSLLLGHDLRVVRPLARLEVPFFLLLSTVGMMMLVSATEMVTFYVSLELAATGLYLAIAVHREPRFGGEPAVKFVLFGIVGSAVTIYGLSLVLGTTGSPYFERIATVLGDGGSPLLLVGALLVLASLLFKLAAFPFHFWAPDVYQRAPQSIVTFVATASKLAAVGVLLRIVSVMTSPADGSDRVLWTLAVLSMTVGTLAALAQRDFRRLLGYSAAAHAGYLMLAIGGAGGVDGTGGTGVTAALFYGLVYVFMTALVFVVVCALDRDGRRSRIEDLNGLHRRSPGLAFFLLVSMFALAGIPPTAGFTGKWFVFSAALERGRFGLVLIATINSTIALYYCLRVVRAAYLEPPPEGVSELRVTRPEWVAGVIAAALTLAAGVFPGPLWEAARAAARGLGG
jgi:NADH-quinone oxidoreductase subunit N